MPLPPSRRDVMRPPDPEGRNLSDLSQITRHHGQSLRSRDPGFLDGRWATPQPLPRGASQIVGGDGEGEAGDPTNYEWEWSDRHSVTVAGQQLFVLSHVPVDESLVIRWHPGGGGPVTQINERWVLDDQTVTIPDLDGDIEPGDLFSAQYQFDPGLEEASEVLDALVFRGAEDTTLPGSTVPLPTGTELGDLLVVGSAVMRSDGIPGLVVPVDGRLTRLSHNAWIGTVTDLSGVLFQDFGADDRFQGVVATFAPPAFYDSSADAGPGDDAASPMTSPVVPTTAAILIGTTENPNGTGGFVTVPAGWVNGFNDIGGAVSTVQLWYWVDAASDTSPAGALAYNTHGADGFAYATVIGLVGE